ncbi:MAG: hypothetical protein ACUVWX_15150, partial [Kiritimatiellia bacterium]
MLTSGNSSVFINPDSGAGVYYWLVDGVNHLAKQWWWYRFGDTPERPIETLGPVVPIRYAPNLVELRYTGTEVDAVLRYTLVGGLPGSGSATLSESVRLQNKTTVPADLHLFEYTDFDLFGTAADDTAVLVNRSTISQWDGAILATETSTVGGITPLPSRWEIAEYPWLLGKLNDSKPDFLAEQVTPFGPGNATFAFQWDFQICPGCSQLLSKSKIISPAGAIGDTVWYDSNRNGLLDAGETGIPN